MKILQRLRAIYKSLRRPSRESLVLPVIFEHFQEILADNQRAMEIIADMGEKAGGEYIFDRQYLADVVLRLHDLVLRLVKGLNLVAANRYTELYETLDRVFLPLQAELSGRLSLAAGAPLLCRLDQLPLDNPELTGGKASNLAQISQRLGLPVPAGFVITTQAYRRFLEHNLLETQIHAVLENWQTGRSDERQSSRQLQYHFLAGTVPSEVVRAISAALAEFPKETLWAVRSSAYGEDGELSFAGLHKTLLQVADRGLLPAYKEVLASLYSSAALVYRRKMGLLGEEAAMAVLCQQMVSARLSGVAHSRALEVNEPRYLMIYAAPGTGEVVSGRSVARRLLVAREAPHRISWWPDDPADVATAVPWPELFPQHLIEQLAGWIVTIERYFKRVQEIEWAIDNQARLWILQTRNLQVPQEKLPELETVYASCSSQTLLLQNQGAVAHAGIGAGPVFQVQNDADMDRFPDGAILVTPFTAPWLARIVPKAAGIIAERGSVAGHLATIAREFRVPTLVGVPEALKLLPGGQEVTLDTYSRRVYLGRVQELLDHEVARAMVFEDTAEFRLLRRLWRRIAPLHLIDPQAPNFTPTSCTSVHDIVRFIHEKAVQELMNIPRNIHPPAGFKVWTLSSDVPLDLKILDLGGGVDPEATGSRLTLDQVWSRPLRVLWEELSCPGVWNTEPIPVDFRGLMASLTRTQAEVPGLESGAGIDLAVISGTYLNLNLRLGYHFNLIDARLEEDPGHNHIYFRFVGGVTDLTRRSRRAMLLARILSRHYFKVDVKGDLVVARVLHLAGSEIEARLRLLGRLIGFTRQLDIRLRSDMELDYFEQLFLQQGPPVSETRSEGGQHGTATEDPGLGR